MNIKHEAYASFGIPFRVEGDEYIWNFPDEAPSQEAIDAKIVELEKIQYQRDRAVAYDPIPEQLDQIYHDIDGWKAKVKAVKDKYPKPT